MQQSNKSSQFVNQLLQFNYQRKSSEDLHNLCEMLMLKLNLKYQDDQQFKIAVQDTKCPVIQLINLLAQFRIENRQLSQLWQIVSQFKNHHQLMQVNTDCHNQLESTHQVPKTFSEILINDEINEFEQLKQSLNKKQRESANHLLLIKVFNGVLYRLLMFELLSPDFKLTFVQNRLLKNSVNQSSDLKQVVTKVVQNIVQDDVQEQDSSNSVNSNDTNALLYDGYLDSMF